MTFKVKLTEKAATQQMSPNCHPHRGLKTHANPMASGLRGRWGGQRRVLSSLQTARQYLKR